MHMLMVGQPFECSTFLFENGMVIEFSFEKQTGIIQFRR